MPNIEEGKYPPEKIGSKHHHLADHYLKFLKSEEGQEDLKKRFEATKNTEYEEAVRDLENFEKSYGPSSEKPFSLGVFEQGVKLRQQKVGELKQALEKNKKENGD